LFLDHAVLLTPETLCAGIDAKAAPALKTPIGNFYPDRHGFIDRFFPLEMRERVNQLAVNFPVP
jgi:hypothetical protein